MYASLKRGTDHLGPFKLAFIYKAFQGKLQQEEIQLIVVLAQKAETL